MPTNTKKSISRVLLKTIVVNVFNILVLIALVVLLKQLPTVANEVKKANSQKQISEHAVDSAVLNSEVEKSKDKSDALTAILSGDKTVIAFVSKMDEIKAKGIMTTYEFPVSTEVQDKSGLHGLPVIATITGTKQEVSDTMVEISQIPLLTKPVTLTMSIDETGAYTALYGIFLYTE